MGSEFEIIGKNGCCKDIGAIGEILKESSHAVFFGGAGVSTDSGIPDFRGKGGLYTEGESKEYYLSRECFENEPEEFFRFFRKNMVFMDAMPNKAHIALAKMEEQGIIKAVITQNIDRLHQKAGSRRVIELHGTAYGYYCTKCGRVFDEKILTEQMGALYCDKCNSLVRPDITLYGERLDGFNYMDAEQEISKADVLIAGGSSLTVNPAASLVGGFGGKHLIIINYQPTPYDTHAEYVIRGSLSEALSIFAEK